MQRLSNFARIVRKYFSAADCGLDKQLCALNEQKERCPLLKDSYNLSQSMIDLPFAFGSQRKLLKQLKDRNLIAPNSWALVSFNSFCKKPSDCFQIANLQESADESNIATETARTFDYMFSGDWMSPRLWVPQYKKTLAKLQKSGIISKDSKLIEIFNQAETKHKLES